MDILITEIANTAGQTIGNPFLLVLGAMGALVLGSGAAARIAMLVEELPHYVEEKEE